MNDQFVGPMQEDPFVGPPEEEGVLTPALIQQMVALGTLSDQQAEVLRQKMRMEEAQNDSFLRGGIRTRAGFTADNPLSGIATLLRQYKAKKEADKYGTEYDDILAKQQAGRAKAGAILGNLYNRPQSPPPIVPQPRSAVPNGPVAGGAAPPVQPQMGPPAPTPIVSSPTQIQDMIRGTTRGRNMYNDVPYIQNHNPLDTPITLEHIAALLRRGGHQ